MPPRSPQPDGWESAVRRASDATGACQPGGMDETCWDDVAMRGIVATVLYALHLRDRQPVEAIRWQTVLWQLHDDRRIDALVTAVLPGAGHDLSRTAPLGDPVTECWRWLTRTWDPNPPADSALRQQPLSHTAPADWVPDAPEPRWGGLSRGIGRGLPDPALEVCTEIWAAGVVQQAIVAERGGHSAHDRVEVTAGPFKGCRGYVREVGWHVDDTAETVDGPAGYVVDLDNVEGTERIDADQVKECSDLSWPRRPEGTLKYGPPSDLNNPPPPPKTCAENLEEILRRAANPEIVPEQLRRTIGAGRRHHHVQLDWQASPSPQRFTWRVLLHWYQLTDHYADDQRANLYEVIVTRHLDDPEPAHLLALSEGDVPSVIARCTAGPRP